MVGTHIKLVLKEGKRKENLYPKEPPVYVSIERNKTKEAIYTHADVSSPSITDPHIQTLIRHSI